MGTTAGAAAVGVGEQHLSAGIAEERAVGSGPKEPFPGQKHQTQRAGKFKVGTGPAEAFTGPTSSQKKKENKNVFWTKNTY